MTSYFQTTIHSRNSKFQKTHGDGMGRLAKGTTSASKRNPSQSRHISHLNILDDQPMKDQSIRSQVQNKENNKKQKQLIKKRTNQAKFNRGTYIGESDIFPAIFFKKTTMRQIFKEFAFPQKCKSLQPNDQRCSLIFQIIGNLFNQITFYVFNLLIAQNPISKSYFAFFSDSQTIPFTKCCNTPAYIELHSNGTGRILCNSKTCQHPSLAEFLISYEDGSKLWKDMTFLPEASQIDRNMKMKISNYIKTGKYRKRKLQSVINGTSKQVQKYYYSSKGNQKSTHSVHQTPFLTDIHKKKTESQDISSTQREILAIEQNQETSLSNQKPSQLLKIKLSYIAKKNRGLDKKITRGLIQEGKVFNKKFEMMDKLQELVEQNKADKTYSKMTFPKLLQKLKVRQDSKSRGKPRNISFAY